VSFQPRDVAQPVERERPAELAVDPPREVEVEFGGDALRVVVGGLEHGDVLDEVHADQQLRIPAERQAHRAQQVDRGARDHVADRRAGEEAELGQAGDGFGQGAPAS
jgi:hypothetical protein